MKLKLDANGNVVVQDGKPVYVDADGKDVAYDAPAMHSKIIELGKESQKHRETADAATVKLKAFEAIPDVALAVKALDIVKNLDDKKLIEAGEVENIKAAAKKASEDKVIALEKAHATEITKLKDENGTLRTTYNGEKVAGAFAASKFVADKLAIPSDLVQARFDKSFKVEDGKIIGYDSSGNKLYSRAKPGDPAEFDEALELLVDAYPNKEQILKGTGSTGTGGKPVSDGRGGHPGFKGKGNMGGTKEERTAAIRSRFGKDLA